MSMLWELLTTTFAIGKHMWEAVFMGHVITTDGLQPNPVTIQAIVNR